MDFITPKISQKGHVIALRSKALPALKRLALMDAAKAAQLAPEVVQMRLLQEEREREATQEKWNDAVPSEFPETSVACLQDLILLI